MSNESRKKVALGNLCYPPAGQIQVVDDTLIDYIDISSVSNESKSITGYQTLRFSEAPSRARKPLKKDSILVSTVRPNLNAVALFDFETQNTPVASTGFCVLDCKEEVNPRFVFNFCKSQTFISDMVSQATGASYPAVSDKIVRTALIPEYSYKEQCVISSVLEKIAHIIDNRKKQIAALDDLIKARFVEMFGDPVVNSMDWQKQRFDSLCENLDGKRRPITSTDRIEGPYPYYGASGIVDFVADYIFDEDILLISEDGANLLARSTPIAFSVSGKVWVNNHAHVVRFSDFALQKYIEYYFAMISIEDYITGSTQPKLNQAKLNGMMIPIPSKDKIEKYLCFIRQIDKSKAVVQKALDKAQVLFDRLMQQYFG